jgi:RNA polymerase sigma-70 factor (ECF subfamily)
MTAEIVMETVVRRHRAGLWRYLRLLGCDGPTADDLVQETFLALMDASFEERDPRATAAWLRKKARFLFLSGLRRRVRRREARLAEIAEEVWVECAGEDGGDGYLGALRDCLDTLPPRSRRAVELRYGSRTSREEMARSLEMKPNGVKTLLSRIRGILRTCVEERMAR